MEAGCIRRAGEGDLSRIAEILVFAKRLNYRPIFHDDGYSFGELQVLNVVDGYRSDPARLAVTWVYDDGFVKGLIQIEGTEIRTLYVEPLFTGQGVGGQLVDFAISRFGVTTLWVLAKNERAQAFYGRHGFACTGRRRLEEGTVEYLVEMHRTAARKG